MYNGTMMPVPSRSNLKLMRVLKEHRLHTIYFKTEMVWFAEFWLSRKLFWNIGHYRKSACNLVTSKQYCFCWKRISTNKTMSCSIPWGHWISISQQTVIAMSNMQMYNASVMWVRPLEYIYWITCTEKEHLKVSRVTFLNTVDVV